VAKVGMAIGLAYTASGGSTTTVEAEKFPGEGKIKATGKLGEVLKESVEAALAYLKANAEELGINQQLFKKYDLHLHLPEGAIAKDGPSAGITIYVALASLLSGKKVRQDIAMTGELTLKGRVLPIGGLKEKLSAAVRENITTVIILEGNKRDLAKISHDIKGVLTIKTISHASELLNIVFINKK
jgi:ATP-dependent Lon protease